MPIIGRNTIAFGFRAFKKFPELAPLSIILSAALTMATAFTGYSLYQKPDVWVLKHSELPPFERVDPTKSQKLVTFHQKYEPIPELEALRKEIGSYKH